MTKNVTFGQVHRLLLKLGWERTPVEGKHVLFEHKPSKGLLVMRPHRLSETVDPMTLGVVKMNLDLRGFLDEGEFADALREVSANGKPKARRASNKARARRE